MIQNLTSGIFFFFFLKILFRACNFLYLSTRSSGHHHSFLISDFLAEILKAS